jgi:hypothetical protein
VLVPVVVTELSFVTLRWGCGFVRFRAPASALIDG